MRLRWSGILAVFTLTACMTWTQPGPGGTLTGKLNVRWIGENRFVYEPDAQDPLTFVSTDTSKIIPARMLTDGGSIPPVFWGAPGLSPWGYGPAYIIHDWLFDQHHCKYAGWESVSLMT